ncbi:hypothetical protein K469DRAFT_686628 [Zopfia rhizophila CBS 207.26]|uniref:Uncharacterized protein n=1 Tax=Zopfia rhizophila CBS 207.26 TaxID=1314779 RepID=A0A6A6ETW3_9PEZI|nr:hypothetical protein K469DRAFT_686628 [Zopfia rhizophila CBS 207.26]
MWMDTEVEMTVLDATLSADVARLRNRRKTTLYTPRMQVFVELTVDHPQKGPEKLTRHILKSSSFFSLIAKNTNAIELPQLGMKGTQSNLEHWKWLYELEVLQVGLEEEAFDALKEKYWYLDKEDLEKLEVPVMVFERWLQISEMPPDKNRWYKGKLRDGRRVEVKLENGKISASEV